MHRSTLVRTTASRRRPVVWTGLVAALLGLSVACGGTPAAGPEQPAASSAAAQLLQPATLKPGSAIPVPAGRPVLTLTGKVAAVNRKAAVLLDTKTLDRLDQVRVRVYDPWVKQTVEFRAVSLQDLLALAGASATATTLHITALDDYQVDLALTDVRAGGVFLATRSADGSGLAIEKGGPIRIVFADGVAAGANPDQWIWSLKTIDVR
jgi:hypothetical protein